MNYDFSRLNEVTGACGWYAVLRKPSEVQMHAGLQQSDHSFRECGSVPSTPRRFTATYALDAQGRETWSHR
jgi:hypothetical protein